jgi:TatD DNase family protein
MFFDSHCHLTDPAFANDLNTVLERARGAGVEGLVTIASTPADARAALALARAHAGLWSTAGIHPHEADLGGDEGQFEALRELLARQEVVAVGECGLDFHYDNAPREVQLRTFERQIELADETALPLVVHSRSADREMELVLRSLPSGVRGVLHCFTGGDALLEAGLEAGWWISFSGIVTFPRFDAAHRVLAVPDDRLLVETDAPYLAPVPHRGRRNEPAFIGETVAAVAAIRRREPAELAGLVTANARTFYGLS